MKDYNCIYAQLVKSDDDLVGLVAYGLYKQHKIDFIKSFAGKEITEKELEGFHKATNTPKELELYRSRAENIIADIMQETLEEELERRTKQIYSNCKEDLKEVIMFHKADMLEEQKKNIKESIKFGYWKPVGQSMLATFFISIILTIILIMGNFSEKTTNQIANKLQQEITQNKDSLANDK